MPALGIGYDFVDTLKTKMAFDIGLGRDWERNAGMLVATSGSLTIGETLAQVLTATTTLTESFSELWKITDFGDSLHVLSLGLSATMSTRTQLKVELLDMYKNKPPLTTVQKNDVAALVAIVYKIGHAVAHGRIR